MDFPGKNTGAGRHSLLQGIFLTQGLNLSLLDRQANSFTAEPGTMNQDKLEVVKQKMARVNINILGISKVKMDWNGYI